MQVTDKRELKAIHTSDMSELLKKFSQYDDFENGRISCNICNVIISKENIGSIKLLGGKLIFTCNKSSCYNETVRQNFDKEGSELKSNSQ